MASPYTVYRKLLHAIDNHGLAGTLQRVARRAGTGIDSQEPGPPGQPHPFDLLHHTDTGGYIPGEQLAPGTPAGLFGPALYNTAYYGISPSTLTQALARIQLPPGTTFVDLGCGKGRALLVAAAFPFAALLGVELSPELCAIARANAAALSLTHATVLQHDAAALTYPDTPLVVYLYHPFLQPLLRRVLTNLARQRAHSPHPAWLLDANPQYPRLMARQPYLHEQWDHSFELSPEDAAADRHGTTHERYTLFTLHH